MSSVMLSHICVTLSPCRCYKPQLLISVLCVSVCDVYALPFSYSLWDIFNMFAQGVLGAAAVNAAGSSAVALQKSGELFNAPQEVRENGTGEVGRLVEGGCERASDWRPTQGCTTVK